MKTARIGSYTVVEIIKQTAKTSKVRILTECGNKETRVKNSKLSADPIEVLTLENMHTASTILSIGRPENGIKRFTADDSGRGHHSKGVGSNSSVLFESDFHRYRIMTHK